jgi:hypothetical protein
MPLFAATYNPQPEQAAVYEHETIITILIAVGKKSTNRDRYYDF